MRKSIALAFVAFFIITCKSKKDDSQIVQNTGCLPIDLTAAVEDNSIEDWSQSNITYYLSEYIDEVKILPLESNDESIIAAIDNVFFIDDRIIVFDRWDFEHQAKIFNKDGRFINSIHQGQGPGEVEKIYCMTVDYKNKQLLMYHPSGLLYTDLDGKYIKDDRVDYGFMEIAVLGDQYIFKVGEGQLNQYLHDNYEEHYRKTILVTDNEYNPIYSSVPLLDVKPIGISTSVTKTSEGRIAFTKSTNDTIYCYDGDKAYPVYNLVYPNRLMDKTMPETTDEFILMQQTTDAFCNLGYFFETTYTQFFNLLNLKEIVSINAFRDKESGNIIWEKDTRRNGLNSMNTFAIVPKTTYGDYFVGGLEYQFKQQHLKCLRPFLSPEDLKKVENMTEDDNPMLILYKFKKF